MSDHQESARYMELGVSAAKADVYQAIATLTPSLAPGSFCRVVEDIFGNDPGYCVASHADGAGTKSILAYLHYRQHGNPDIFRGIAQDAIVMNLDDLICIGATSGFTVTSIINRNARRIGGEVLRALVEGALDFIGTMNSLGINMVHCGGETADVGDTVRTLLVDSVLSVRFRRDHLVKNVILPNHEIVGLAAGGLPTSYERSWNSGIGSNGLTLARHEMLSPAVVAEFPEILDDTTETSQAYCGPFAPDDKLPESPVTVIEALLSPTRTFAPVVAAILREYLPKISGIVHCSGGGQLKCLRFGRGIRYTKDLGSDLPVLFNTLRKVSGMNLGELARVFNLGFRLEVYCDPGISGDIVQMASAFGLQARRLGYTERASSGQNELILRVDNETFSYAASQRET